MKRLYHFFCKSATCNRYLNKGEYITENGHQYCISCLKQKNKVQVQKHCRICLQDINKHETNAITKEKICPIPVQLPIIQYDVPVAFVIESLQYDERLPVVCQGEALMLRLNCQVAPLEVSLVGNYFNRYVKVEHRQEPGTCAIHCPFQEGTNQITLFGQTQQFKVLLPQPDNMDESSDSQSDGSSPEDGQGGSPDSGQNYFGFLPSSPDNNNNNNNFTSNPYYYSPSQYQMHASDAPSDSHSESNDKNDPSDVGSLPEESAKVKIEAVLPSSIPVGVSQLAAIIGNFEGIHEKSDLEITFGGERGVITSRSSNRIFVKTPIFSNPCHVDVSIRTSSGTEATKDKVLLVLSQQRARFPQKDEQPRQLSNENLPPRQVPPEAPKAVVPPEIGTEGVPGSVYNLAPSNIQGVAANAELQPPSAIEFLEEEKTKKLTPKPDELISLEKWHNPFGELRFTDVLRQQPQLEQIYPLIDNSDWRHFGEELGYQSKQLDDIQYKENPARYLLEQSNSTMTTCIAAFVNTQQQNALNKLPELFPRNVVDIEGIIEMHKQKKMITELTQQIQFEKQQIENLKTQVQNLAEAKQEEEAKLKGEKTSLQQQLDTIQAQVASINTQQVRDRSNGWKISNPWIIISCLVVVVGIGMAIFFAPTLSSLHMDARQIQPNNVTAENQVKEMNQLKAQSPKPPDAKETPKQTTVTIAPADDNMNLHIVGNTYRIKELLKQKGCTWLPSEKAWKIRNEERTAEELKKAILEWFPEENVVIVPRVAAAG